MSGSGRRPERRNPSEAAAAGRRATASNRYRTKVDVLRDAWREAADRSRWARPEDWWTPAVDALAQAVTQRRDQGPACARLGRARAQARLGIQETLDDLDTLYRQLPMRVPPPRLVRALVEAWAEVTLAPIRLTVCGDPRSGFATAAHLRARLAEVYESGDPVEEYAALIIDLPSTMVGTGWEAMTLLLQIGERLRSIFPDDARPARLSPGQLAVLVRRHGALPETIAALNASLPVPAEHTASIVRVVDLPDSVKAAYDLIDRL